MTATIPLAKPYTPEKIKYPCYVSEKLDGVPVKIEWYEGRVIIRSRKDERVYSVGTQALALVSRALGNGAERGCVVAEVTHPGSSFKDTSGRVRTQSQDDELVLNVFDGWVGWGEKSIFQRRWHDVSEAIGTGYMIPQRYACSKAQLDSALEVVIGPNSEGAILKHPNELWAPGKRSWGYMKYVQDPCVDLRVIGFEEAISQHGEPLGMVGRVICAYKGGETGVGPGKLTHAERRELWRNADRQAVYRTSGNTTMLMLFRDRIAQVKYKRDDTYTALRQPTFQCWRDDKSEPNEEV